MAYAFIEADKQIELSYSIDFASPTFLVADKEIELAYDASIDGIAYIEADKRIVFYGVYDNGLESGVLTGLIQQSVVEGFVQLWTLDMSHVGMGVLRFTPGVGPTGDAISFAGNTYLPMPMRAEGFEQNGQGNNARPSLTIMAENPEVTALVISQEGLQGAKVTRTRTLARFLDSGEEPNPTAHFPVGVYRIDRIAEWRSGVYITFELTNALDMENVMIAKRQILRDYCSWIYRRWDPIQRKFIYVPSDEACPYAGDNCFNLKNEFVSADEDKCSKTLDGCKARFGKDAVLPFGGHPGIQTY